MTNNFGWRGNGEVGQQSVTQSFDLNFLFSYRLVGPVVKAFSLRAADPGSNPAFSVDLFPGRVMPVS